MQLTRALGTVVSCSLFATALLLTTPHAARSTDLQDTQVLVNHPAADITDVYAFPAPDNANNVVLVMNTNPLIPSGQGPSTAFDPTVLYQFQIAHTASGPADTVIQFAANTSGTGQTLTMYGPSAPNANQPTVSTVVVSTASAVVPYNKVTTLTVADAAGNPGVPVKVFAGPRADPDYFDLARFYTLFPDRNYQNHQVDSLVPVPAPVPATFRGFATAANACDTTPAVDFFSSGKYNVLSLVVELPKSALAQVPTGFTATVDSSVHIWATTSTVSGV